MRKDFLPFSPPDITEAEKNAVLEVLNSNWLSTGPKTKEFEQVFAEYVGAESALALNSCTAGLHLAMQAYQIKPGDEVITTPMTFCATANVVEHLGGTVVLADIEPDTFLVDPREIEKKITKKTKVIAPVHFAGQPADIEKINQIASSAKIAVVEDAAHCMPSKINDQLVGSFGNLTAFSFYANKNMTTGEGGMLTGPASIIDPLRVRALHGMSRGSWNRFQKGGSWKYDVELPGYKYNMTDIQSALGLVQLSRLNETYSRRKQVVEMYNEAFATFDFAKPLAIRAGRQSSYHIYVIRLDLKKLKISRDQFIVELTERNIGTSVHYTPLHLHSYYKNKYGFKPEDFPNATACFESALTIPLSSKITDAEVHDVIEAVADIGQKFRV